MSHFDLDSHLLVMDITLLLLTCLILHVRLFLSVLIGLLELALFVQHFLALTWSHFLFKLALTKFGTC